MKKIFNKYKRELILMLSTILVVLSVSTYFMHVQVTNSLLSEHINKLNFLKSSLKVHVENYFDTTKNILHTLSSSQTTVDGLQKFTTTFNLASQESNNSYDKKEFENYIKSFNENINTEVPFAKKVRELEAYIPKSLNAKILQNNYIINNPFDANQHYRLFNPHTELSYDNVHKKYHGYFLQELQKYSFYDLFLIDMQGNIVYSVYKEDDFASNLLKGVYKDSNLALVYKQAMLSAKESVVFEDFKPYEPSLNAAAAFMAMPIFDGERKVGVMAIQIPIKEINKIMTLDNNQESVGLGKSGEAYLVGSDMYMRSDSRFIDTIDNPLVSKFLTTVGIVQVNSSSVKKALNGTSGDDLIKDYRGVDVYSAYSPIKIINKEWAILAEIDKQEVFDSVQKSTFTLILMSLIVFILFILLLLFLFVQLIFKPMQKNEELLNENMKLKNKALRTSESLLEEYKNAVDLSAIVSKADKRGVITYVNSEFCKISGYEKEELIGKPHSIVRHPQMRKDFFKNLWGTIQNKNVWKGIIKNLNKNGETYYVNSTIVPMLDEDKNIVEYMAIRTDVTDLVLKEEKILKQTMDSVTSLPNRQKLIEDIESSSEHVALASIHINNLREISDFYGQEISAELIKEIAVVLLNFLNEKIITLYKASGDEFSLLSKNNISMANYEKIVQNLIEHFDYNMIKVDDNEFNISISVGIAGGDKQRLITNSQMALRKAVELSKSYLAFENSSEIEEQFQSNIEMTTKIKNAIHNDDILVFAQPIVANSKDGKEKYECLVRMRDGDKIISPFFFLEISKKARLYSMVTKIVIEKSFDYFKDKTAEFSINLTLDDILNDEVTTLLKRKLIEYNIGDRVVLELVESEGIEDFESVNEFILSMKALGCQIAIDDFGTGYSNFEYLMKLNADYIKIDGSLVKNIHTDKNSELVVQLIVDFAKRLNIKVIAEFIHNKEVQDKIESLEIDYSQGYYFSEPKELKFKEKR